MANSQTHYEVLGVKPQATLDTIKKAYRKTIREHHPDRFAAERARLQREGFTVALTALDKEIQRSQQLTQRANHAYAVLSDVTQRERYDRELAEQRLIAQERAIQRQREEHPDYGRRVVKTRPHRNPAHPPTIKEQTVPWVLLGIFIVALVVVASQISDFLWAVDERMTYRPNAATAEGVIAPSLLQATENARQSVFLTRTVVALTPSPTPRGVADYEASGDVLLQMGSYNYAIEQYTEAIELDADNSNLFYKRGLATIGLYETDANNATALTALDDLSDALALDEQETYHLARGLLRYALWQSTDDSRYAELAQRELSAIGNDTALNSELIENIPLLNINLSIALSALAED